MKNSAQKARGFTVYEFMVAELGLSGNALLVYALLYSFGDCGLAFYGTLEYLSERIGCSVSSVKRLLDSLIKANLITKVYEKDSKTPIYIINDGIEDSENTENKTENGGGEHTADFEPDRGSFWSSEELILSSKNKEIINTTSSTSSSKSACAQRGNSPISFLRYGLNGIVTMTESQYTAFCNLVGDEMAEIYINRLETYLISNPDVCLKSHYKTLCKWVREDASV